MNIKKIREYRLKKPPTDIAVLSNNIYISTKGKRVFFLPEDQEQLKSILFSSQVNAMDASDTTLYCGCSDGRIFGLNPSHKVTFRSFTDPAGITLCKYDRDKNDILASTFSKKVQVFGDSSMLKNTFYCYDSPVSSFDLAKDGTMVCVSQNSQNLKIINTIDGGSRVLKIAEGFPETAKFISKELLLVGTLSGHICIYSVSSLKLLSVYRGSAAVHSLHLLGDCRFLTGTGDSTLGLYEYRHGKVECIEHLAVAGIPVAFCGFGNSIAVAVSREPRLGRWGALKTGKNRMVIIKIEN